MPQLALHVRLALLHFLGLIVHAVPVFPRNSECGPTRRLGVHEWEITLTRCPLLPHAHSLEEPIVARRLPARMLGVWPALPNGQREFRLGVVRPCREFKGLGDLLLDLGIGFQTVQMFGRVFLWHDLAPSFEGVPAGWADGNETVGDFHNGSIRERPNFARTLLDPAKIILPTHKSALGAPWSR